MANSNSLKRYRLFIGLTQKQLATAINMKLGSYQAKEQGRVSFSDNEKVEIKSIFLNYIPDVTIDNLFFSSPSTEKVH